MDELLPEGRRSGTAAVPFPHFSIVEYAIQVLPRNQNGVEPMTLPALGFSRSPTKISNARTLGEYSEYTST